MPEKAQSDVVTGLSNNLVMIARPSVLSSERGMIARRGFDGVLLLTQYCIDLDGISLVTPNHRRRSASPRTTSSAPDAIARKTAEATSTALFRPRSRARPDVRIIGVSVAVG
jgi:hypothetical protein